MNRLSVIEKRIRLIKNYDSFSRNVINQNEINFFLKGLIDNKLEAHLYINSVVRNYLLKEAPVKIYSSNYKNKLTKKEQLLVKMKPNKYHIVVLNKHLKKDIEDTLSFVKRKFDKYPINSSFSSQNKQRILENLFSYEEKKKEEGLVENIHEFVNGFRLVKLIDKQSFRREGFLMRNCVYDRFVKNNVAYSYYSLRDLKNKPLLLLEISNNIIIECKTFANNNGKRHFFYNDVVNILIQKEIIKQVDRFSKNSKNVFINDHWNNNEDNNHRKNKVNSFFESCKKIFLVVFNKIKFLSKKNQ